MDSEEREKPAPAVLNYLSVLIRWHKVVIRLVAGATFMMVIFSLISPKVFTSQALIVPAREGPGLDVYNALSGNLLGLCFVTSKSDWVVGLRSLVAVK